MYRAMTKPVSSTQGHRAISLQLTVLMAGLHMETNENCI
jgi:hypothetical protein